MISSTLASLGGLLISLSFFGFISGGDIYIASASLMMGICFGLFSIITAIERAVEKLKEGK
ncbi:MAG: hypothetical protein H8D63_00715 [Parcubacteria group bacterium]|nr:hypothetical protein [Parcubacteria group bacterium]